MHDFLKTRSFWPILLLVVLLMPAFWYVAWEGASQSPEPATTEGNLQNLLVDGADFPIPPSVVSRPPAIGELDTGTLGILPDRRADLERTSQPPVPEQVLPALAETRRMHAETGIWVRTPDRPMYAPFEINDAMHFPDIDQQISMANHVALFFPRVNPAELLRRIPPPPPFNEMIASDANNDVGARAIEALTSQGAVVINGLPPINPTPRPSPLDCISVWPVTESEAFRDGRLVSVNLGPQFLVFLHGEYNGSLFYYRGFPSPYASEIAIGQFGLELSTVESSREFAAFSDISPRYLANLASRSNVESIFVSTLSARGTRVRAQLDRESFLSELMRSRRGNCNFTFEYPESLTHTESINLVVDSFGIAADVVRAAFSEGLNNFTRNSYPPSRPLSRPTMRPEAIGADAQQQDFHSWQTLGPARFLASEPSLLIIDDQIENGHAEIIREAIIRNDVRMVILDSPGGVLADSLEIAEAIRAAQVDTFIPLGARCESACAYIFLGGVRRSAEGALSVHQLRARLVETTTARVDIDQILQGSLNFTLRILALGAPSWLMERISSSRELVDLSESERFELSLDAENLNLDGAISTFSLIPK